MLKISNFTQEHIDGAKLQCPMARLLNPMEIASGVMFLSGSDASAVTGIKLYVDGGATLFRVV